MNRKSIFVFILLFSIGLVVGLRLNVGKKNCFDSPGFKYINKFLSCDKVAVINKAEYTVFSSEVKKYINSEVKDGKITRMGVYFRDLASGPTVSINGDEKFAPASLLKVPVAIAYFRAEEEMNNKGNTESILDRHIAYKGELRFDYNSQFYKPKETLAPGVSYSIRDLLFRMLAYSDNGSYEGLMTYLAKLFPTRDYLLETFGDLGIIDPKSGLDQTLSPRTLSADFRLLYNASYLSKEHSEELLDMLVKSEFKLGLVAGIPKNVEVAHKFGERQLGSNGQWEFHDCGIVYYPGNPYLICIMTQGDEPAQILGVLSRVSEMFYKEFDSRKL